MIDCHNHMLPGIDDGAHDWDMAIAMAERAVASGISTVVCTPHHMNGAFTNHREQILDLIEQLEHVLQRQQIELTLVPGSELHLVPELIDQIQTGRAMTYADLGKAVLLELPKRSIPVGTEAILEALIRSGLTPVIAHPERNSTLADEPDIAVQWTTWGCKLQLTAMSCSGRFGKSLQNVSRYLVEQGAAHIIASDAHRPRGRAPDMRGGAQAIESWVGEEAAFVMTHRNPANLISGQPLEPVPLAPGKPSRRSATNTGQGRGGTKRGFLQRLFKR